MNITEKQRAQETVLNETKKSLTFSIQFYEKEYNNFISKSVSTTGFDKEHSEYMAQHCLYMKESYETLLSFINHLNIEYITKNNVTIDIISII